MKKYLLFFGLIFILLISLAVLQRNENQNQSAETPNPAAPAANTPSDGVNRNSSEYTMYRGISGDQFDQIYIANMIAHHEGAVQMAEQALSNTMNPDIRTLANGIVSTQNEEIKQMLSWQKAWGYPDSSREVMQDHSAMGMMDDMDIMTQKLTGLKDSAFDKTFLELMIQHHQSAINMSAPAETNAKHAELKNLAEQIITAQKSEISTMQAWLQSWF